jgi:hypothetical protein
MDMFGRAVYAFGQPEVGEEPVGQCSNHRLGRAKQTQESPIYLDAVGQRVDCRVRGEDRSRTQAYEAELQRTQMVPGTSRAHFSTCNAAMDYGQQNSDLANEAVPHIQFWDGCRQTGVGFAGPGLFFTRVNHSHARFSRFALDLAMMR